MNNMNKDSSAVFTLIYILATTPASSMQQEMKTDQ